LPSATERYRYAKTSPPRLSSSRRRTAAFCEYQDRKDRRRHGGTMHSRPHRRAGWVGIQAGSGGIRNGRVGRIPQTLSCALAGRLAIEFPKECRQNWHAPMAGVAGRFLRSRSIDTDNSYASRGLSLCCPTQVSRTGAAQNADHVLNLVAADVPEEGKHTSRLHRVLAKRKCSGCHRRASRGQARGDRAAKITVPPHVAAR
jgi:hypothetical protein